MQPADRNNVFTHYKYQAGSLGVYAEHEARLLYASVWYMVLLRYTKLPL